MPRLLHDGFKRYSRGVTVIWLIATLAVITVMVPAAVEPKIISHWAAPEPAPPAAMLGRERNRWPMAYWRDRWIYVRRAGGAR